MSISLLYAAFCAANVVFLKEVNVEVVEPYMVSFPSYCIQYRFF